MACTLKENPTTPIPVVQLALEGGFIDSFRSISEAARILNLDPTRISQTLSGKSMSAGGYLFLEQEKYNNGKRITYNSLKRKRGFLKS